jgi:protocatechuate 3,4-dioxygenase beta subunit
MDGLIKIDEERLLNRRQLLGRAASSAVVLFLSQTPLACADKAAGNDDDDNDETPACVLTADLTEGPFFFDEKLNRTDIRSDPDSGDISAGVPLNLKFNVLRIVEGVCTPLTGAYIDVWHCDAEGVYSGVDDGEGRKFLRGYQITDAAGVAQFITVYPGWYQGRAVHIHFKLRLITGQTTTYEFTSQFFFDELTTSTVYGNSPYKERGTRDRLNTQDGIYNSLTAAEKAALTLRTTPNLTGGYDGEIDLVVQVG